MGGEWYIVKSRVAEIGDLAASDTVEMMVIVGLGVESPGERIGFDHVDYADLGKGKQRPVHRVKRNCWLGIGNLPVHPVRRRVIGAVHEQFVDGKPLWCHFQACFPAAFDEPVHAFFLYTRLIHRLFFVTAR